jgi:hypothetical protein
MVRKRTAYDPLEPTTAPRWHVVRTMQGSVVESHPIPAGTDLKRLLIESMLKWMDTGWQIPEFSSTTGTFFCIRQNERRMVSISPTDPDDVPGQKYGNVRQGGCPTCGD